MRGDLQINSGSAQSRPWSLSHVPAGEHQLVDNGVFHHRRSMGPSAPGAKTCSTCCSMVPSSLVPSKKIRASLTVQICFNIHNMDKMSISNHVSAVGHSVLGTRLLQAYLTSNLSAGKLPTWTGLVRRLTMVLKVEGFRRPRRMNLERWCQAMRHIATR